MAESARIRKLALDNHHLDAYINEVADPHAKKMEEENKALREECADLRKENRLLRSQARQAGAPPVKETVMPAYLKVTPSGSRSAAEPKAAKTTREPATPAPYFPLPRSQYPWLRPDSPEAAFDEMATRFSVFEKTMAGLIRVSDAAQEKVKRDVLPSVAYNHEIIENLNKKFDLQAKMIHQLGTDLEKLAATIGHHDPEEEAHLLATCNTQTQNSNLSMELMRSKNAELFRREKAYQLYFKRAAMTLSGEAQQEKKDGED